jgi:hypothetical protein
VGDVTQYGVQWNKSKSPQPPIKSSKRIAPIPTEADAAGLLTFCSVHPNSKAMTKMTRNPMINWKVLTLYPSRLQPSSRVRIPLVPLACKQSIKPGQDRNQRNNADCILKPHQLFVPVWRQMNSSDSRVQRQLAYLCSGRAGCRRRSVAPAAATGSPMLRYFFVLLDFSMNSFRSLAHVSAVFVT